LHVLSTPPAFILSQDQTLRKCITDTNTPTRKKSGHAAPNSKPAKKTAPNHPQQAGQEPSIQPIKKQSASKKLGTLLSSQTTDTYRIPAVPVKDRFVPHSFAAICSSLGPPPFLVKSLFSAIVNRFGESSSNKMNIFWAALAAGQYAARCWESLCLRFGGLPRRCPATLHFGRRLRRLYPYPRGFANADPWCTCSREQLRQRKRAAPPHPAANTRLASGFPPWPACAFPA
jgi:hypothetical protein